MRTERKEKEPRLCSLVLISAALGQRRLLGQKVWKGDPWGLPALATCGVLTAARARVRARPPRQKRCLFLKPEEAPLVAASRSLSVNKWGVLTEHQEHAKHRGDRQTCLGTKDEHK